MPILTSSFSPPAILRPAWVQTIAPVVMRANRATRYRDELLQLPCGDVLELFWHHPNFEGSTSITKALGLVVLTHGLEGSMQSGYISGLSRTLTAAGYLVLTWNMRGCGGAPNYLPQWYHSRQSEDLAKVLEHARSQHPGLNLFAVGFSIGGNILCKYLGEAGASNRSLIKAAIAISSPLDLRGSAEILAKPSRRIYMEYLLRPLRARIREKAQLFPELFDTARLDAIRTFHEFDARYTAPIHGFKSVEHYYDECSGINYLKANQTPLLILSARDDPFLSAGCFPDELARDSELLCLEAPRFGGHVGFVEGLLMRRTWGEMRVVEFLQREK